jgi:GDP-4-dehydro-6-deoxy-D-mannose reductase
VKVLVTGANGFAGGWLMRELESAGHDAIAAPRGSDDDLWNSSVLLALLQEVRPDAVAHLAAVSFAPDASGDPVRAIRTNVGGTQALIEALRSTGRRICLLVTGSSEVYGRPDPATLPLTEEAPLRTTTPYGLSKLAQEAVAVAGAVRYGIPTVVTRAFNHTGPGQRPMFAVPAFAQRVLAVRAGQATAIAAGNVDVRRDLGDVRDVVVAYRLLLELLRDEGAVAPIVANVATGSSVSMREVIGELCRAAGVDAPIEIDPALVRANDPEEIRGDSTLLRTLTGWEPRRGLAETLRGVLASAAEDLSTAARTS